MDALVSNVDVLKTTSGFSRKSAGATNQLDKTAKDFESVFMAQMLKPMWEGVETNAMFGGGPGEDVMKDLLIQEYGKSMARDDTSGLSTAIKDAMIRMQEVADAHAA